MCDLSTLPNDHSKILIYEILLEHKLRNIKCEVSEGSEKGDNYVGDIKRIKIVSKKDESVLMSLIMKYTPNKDKFKAIPDAINLIYDRESSVYRLVLPTLVRIQEEFNVPKDEMFMFAKCHKADNQMLIMEDLCANGFRMHDRYQSFDSHHLELVLRTYARFHALSFAMREHYPDVYSDLIKFVEKVLGEEAMEGFLTNLSAQAISVVHDYYKEKLKVFCEDIVDKVKKLTDPNEVNPYSVICHGDCWNNNMLFKYQNDIPTDVKFVDWQVARYCSPLTDLAYMICASTDSKTRSRYGKRIFSIYYDALDKHLQYFKLSAQKCYPRRIFDVHVEQFLPFGLIMGIIVIPIILTEKGNEIDVEDMMDSEKKSLCFGKANTERLNDLVGDFVDMQII